MKFGSEEPFNAPGTAITKAAHNVVRSDAKNCQLSIAQQTAAFPGMLTQLLFAVSMVTHNLRHVWIKPHISVVPSMDSNTLLCLRG